MLSFYITAVVDDTNHCLVPSAMTIVSSSLADVSSSLHREWSVTIVILASSTRDDSTKTNDFPVHRSYFLDTT